MTTTIGSLSKRAQRSQYLDLRTRGYSHEDAEAEVEITNDYIVRLRQQAKDSA